MREYDIDRLYAYAGSDHLLPLDAYSTERTQVEKPDDVCIWVHHAERQSKRKPVIAAFIIDAAGSLWIADRQSEHVACARGTDVLSAGEMTFAVSGSSVEVIAVTNQSTGYCPEPESWPAVAAALDRAQIVHPNQFTQAFTFRLCKKCGQSNIIKDNDFTCGVCVAELDKEWNF